MFFWRITQKVGRCNQLRYQFFNTTLYIISGALILSTLMNVEYQNESVSTVLTFFIIGIISVTGSVCTRDNISLRRMLYLFSFIFFFMAPLQQIGNNVVFWRDQGLIINYSNSDYTFANTLIIVFLLLFEISYRIHHSKTVISHKAKSSLENYFVSQRLQFVFIVISMICVAFLIGKGQLFSTREQLAGLSTNLSFQAVNIARYVPLTILALTIILIKNDSNSIAGHQRFFLTISGIINFAIFFPFNGAISRFLLFGAYLMLYAICFQSSKVRSLFFLIFIIGFFYFFSAFNIFKGSGDLSQFALVSPSALSGVDFDAYQLFLDTIQYVHIHGYVYGQNLLSAATCFLPRSLFSFRLQATGMIVAESFGSNFGNVSNPLISEAFFAFGVPGIVIGAVFFGRFAYMVDRWQYNTRISKRLFFFVLAGMSVFLFRGSLLPSWSYTFSFLVSVVIVVGIMSIFQRKKLRGIATYGKN